MNKNNQYLQPSINIKELLYYILKHWRSICIVMILCGVIMAGISYEKSCKTVKAQQDAKQEEHDMTVDEYIDGLDLDDESKVHIKDSMEILDSHQASYNQMAYYLKNSVLMNLDASKVPTCTLTYYVDNKQVVEYPHISETNNTTAIVQALISSLYTDELQSDVHEIIGEEAVDYITEIINTTFSTGNNGSFVIDIHYKDEESVRKISEVVQEQLKREQKELQASFGEFDLTLGTNNYYVGANTDLLDEQRILANNMANILDAMTKTKNALTDEEKDNYEKIVSFEKMKQTKNEDSDMVISPSISKKWLIVGVILGILLVFAWYLCAFLWGSVLKTEDEFEQNDTNLIGIVHIKEKRKKVLFVIDNLVDRLFGKKVTVDMTSEIEIIATKIMMKAGENKNIALSGCAFSDAEKDIAKELCAYLEKNGINLTVAPSMMENGKTMTTVCNAEMIFFMEEIGKSNVSEIREQITFARQLNKKIGGAIVVA